MEGGDDLVVGFRAKQYTNVVRIVTCREVLLNRYQRGGGHLFTLQTVDQTRYVARAEAVVDVDDGYVARTGVQHAEQGGEAVKARAITDAGGYGDYRAGDQSAYYAGQSAFHAG